MDQSDSSAAGFVQSSTHGSTQNCPRCGKWFERKDTLKRHMKIHDTAHRARKSRKKNCISCIRSKVRCSGDRPSCARCARRGSTCLYEHDGSVVAPAPQPSQSFTSSQCSEPQQVLANAPGFMENASQLLAPSLAQQVSSPRDEMGGFLNWGSFFPRLADLQILDRASSNSVNDIFTSYFRGLPSQDSTLDPIYQQAVEQSSQPHEAVEAVHGSTEVPPLPRNSNNGRPKRGYGDLQELNSRSTNSKEASKLPNLGWGQGAETVYPRRFSLLTVDDATYESLQNCLRLPLTRSPWQPVSLDAFPSKEKLDYLIDLYFANFDNFLPMIHRPTFSPGDDPALTLAMCAIGACFSSLESSQEFAESLCNLLRQLLIFMSEFDASYTRSESHLTAQLIQSVLGKGSASKRLFELGDNNRGIMVANARAMWLFDHVDPVPLCSADDLQSRWEAWIRVERSKRLAWCVYIFDASATYYRNCRPHLSLVEVKMGLPCSTEHWEAGSAQAWAALHPWTTSVPPSVSFRDTINKLFEEERSFNEHHAEIRHGSGGTADTPRQKTIDKVPDEFHRMLVATTLIRSVWDLRESLNEPALTPAGPLAYSVFPSNIDTLLSVLGNLTTNALMPVAASLRHGYSGRGVAPHTEREFRGFVLRARVSLIAQIIAVDGVTDHLSIAWSRQPQKRTASEATEQRLLTWARADPMQPRKLVYVGARLLAISRLYPYHYPREPFDALQGGMLVWTMLRLLRKISRESGSSLAAMSYAPGIPTSASTVTDSAPFIPASSSPLASTIPIWSSRSSVPSVARDQTGVQQQQQHQRPPRICQLDWLGHDDALEVQATHDWIHQGGDGFVLRMHGVSDLSTREGEKQVLWETADVLRGMRVWGVSKTYLDMVTWALQSEG